MDPVNPTPTPELVLEGAKLWESVTWPLRVKTAEVTLRMVSEDDVVCTLDCELRFVHETHDVFLVERRKVDSALDPITTLADPARIFMELRGELVPSEDGTAYTIVMERPGG